MNISLRKSVRSIMLVALLLGCVLSLPAQQVTQEAALKKAEQFLGKASLSRRAPQKTPQLTLANNRDEFYVFNDKANGGYVIVSGEERMPDVLAYSYDSRFDADNMPCNMKAWLEGYAEQVKYLRTHPEASARRTTTERENVGPLMTCWFAQGSPYNDKCPEVDGKHCVTGCVATAMAQIMYYWKWPEQTTDVIPGYTSYTHNIEMPAIPVTTIDWDNMLGQYKSWESYTKEQTDAISTLMLLCGTSVYMDYTPSASGAGDTSTLKAFRHYFDYDDMLEYFSRFDNTEYWEQMIYDEINNKRPIFYSGIGYDGSGHAFVLDGYEDGYFHVNWGWGGDESYVMMTDTDGWWGYVNIQSAIVGIQPALADNPSRYAVLDKGKMTLFYDKKKSSRSGTVLVHKDDWVNYREKITECVIDESFANLKQRNLKGYFQGFENLKSIKGIKNLNTSEVCNMNSMFRACSSLTNLDVSGFKTDNVTDMNYMFGGCSSLTNLDVSGFKTDNVEDMSSMFAGCSGLTSLDVSGFKTDNVTDMRWMFERCSGLTSLDVSGLHTSNVTSMTQMFQGCSSLTELDVSGFKTGNVTDMSGMFWGCSSLTKLDVSGFKTDNVTDMGGMFIWCSGLTSLDVSGFKTDNVTSMRSMFFGCSSLTSLDVSGFNTGNVTDICSMFADCSGLTSLDVSGFETDNVTDMSEMFYNCSALTTIYASERWDMSNVTDSKGMFEGCVNLIGGAGTTYYSLINPTTGNVIAEKDWTGGFEGEYPYWYEFDDSQTDGSVTSNPDGIAINVGTLVGKYWEPQVMVTDYFDIEKNGYYKVVITAKYPTNGTLQINMGDWNDCEQITVDIVSTGDFQEVEVLFKSYPFSTTNGHLLFQCGDFKGTTILKNIQVWKMDNSVTDGDYARIDEGPSKPGYFTYKASPIIMGDVNGDGVVNVTDIVATVNYIMEKPSDGFNKEAADLNGDGEINVTDIVKMVTIIMSGDGGSSRRAAATSGNLVISGHNIQLRNAENYIAAQFDINLSDGQSISDIVLNGSSNHDLYWKMINANTCRVVVYSTTNAAFGVNGDNLFNIFINGGQRATISNEILIKADGTTGIDAIRKESENGKVYDLNGRQVNSPRKGVYIINGRKVLVK